MSKLIVTDRNHESHSIEGTAGRSVMEVIRDNGLDELQALCGGCCSCATCHVYIDPAFAALLPPITEDEKDLLEGSSHLTADSRLSCQLRFSDALDGMKVTIAPED